MEIALVGPHIEQDDVAAMELAARAHFIGQGAITRRFETKFSELLGVAGGVATNSGTSALILALRTLDVGPGDEVIIPSYVCLALLNAIVQVGATARLTDIAHDVARMDYNMTAASVRAKLSPRTRAIIVPHMFGVPAEVDKILELGVPVIEDITLSLGAHDKGRPVGTSSELSICSFHSSKMIATGEGGMLTARTPELHQRARYLNGWESEQAALRLNPNGGFEPYELRYNFHLSDLAASLGLSQLEKLPAFIARRKDLARRYTERLSAVPRLGLPEITANENVFYRYLASIGGRDIPSLIEAFAKAGVELGRGVYPPLHRYLQERDQDYPGVAKSVSNLISIPLYPALTETQVEHLLATCVDVLS